MESAGNQILAITSQLWYFSVTLHLMPDTYFSDFPPVDQRNSGRYYAGDNPEAAPTNQTVRATKQKIHSSTNAYNHYLQENIPPNKPYIGLRPAYRPHYAICVILAEILNILSGIIMTAISWSFPGYNGEAYRVLRVLGPIVFVLGFIFLLWDRRMLSTTG